MPPNGTIRRHTAVRGAPIILELWRDFRDVLVRFSAKGIVVPSPFGCFALRFDPEMGQDALDPYFFRLHTGPRGSRMAKKANQVHRNLYCHLIEL
jgi:hypothetical protein